MTCWKSNSKNQGASWAGAGVAPPRYSVSPIAPLIFSHSHAVPFCLGSKIQLTRKLCYRKDDRAMRAI